MPRAVAFYSVRNAITGSFFAAAEAGINPETSVSNTLISTITSADVTGSAASPAIPVSENKIALIANDSK